MDSTKNIMEMSRERDFPKASPVRMRYAILSSPRSGSTLLARMLFETQMAGDPLEYLSPYLLAIERQRSARSKLGFADFVKLMESRRTSENGLFGMQVHYSQFLSAFASEKITAEMIKFVRGFDKLIWVRRRDRLRQAVSFAIARHTKAWSSEEERTIDLSNAAEIHPVQSVRALSTVCASDAGWEMLIKKLSLNVHELWYEDLANNYREHSVSALRFLGLDFDASNITDPPIQRQTTQLNQQVLDHLKNYLGNSASTHLSGARD